MGYLGNTLTDINIKLTDLVCMLSDMRINIFKFYSYKAAMYVQGCIMHCKCNTKYGSANV